MSRSSSSGGAKKGEVWTYKIYFDPEADKDTGSFANIKDEDLIEELTNRVDASEDILNVTAYKHPLSKWQLTAALLYHLFIVFETENWWWSIEKNSEGITIQRSKKIEAVRDRYRQKRRVSGLDKVNTDSGRKSVDDLIRWLYHENELNKEYNYLNSNCQHFAKAVFDHVAKTKNL